MLTRLVPALRPHALHALGLTALALVTGLMAAPNPDPFADARRAMVDEVRRHVAETRAELQRTELDARVVEALRTVPRHEFVPADLRKRAYDDRPLPIGFGQTISQPYIVAVMTDLLEVGPGSRVLEIGTGSGYQAAVLAHMGAQVFTIEIVGPLGEAARERLQRLGYSKAAARIADGYYGWPEQAPFDAIIVTAAANHIPPPLLEQLKPDGRMVIPLGNPFGMQHLLVVRKDKDGRTTTRKVLPVRFVPLTGRAER
jgi:protein-L-isoaspartate(D-aspartate) O-methyltransferase